MTNPLFSQLSGIGRSLMQQGFGVRMVFTHKASGVTTVASGYGTEMTESDAESLAKVGLTLGEEPIIFYIPDAATDRPKHNATVEFDGLRKVTKVKAYRPDGKAMFYYVVLS